MNLVMVELTVLYLSPHESPLLPRVVTLLSFEAEKRVALV